MSVCQSKKDPIQWTKEDNGALGADCPTIRGTLSPSDSYQDPRILDQLWAPPEKVKKYSIQCVAKTGSTITGGWVFVQWRIKEETDRFGKWGPLKDLTLIDKFSDVQIENFDV